MVIHRVRAPRSRFDKAGRAVTVSDMQHKLLTSTALARLASCHQNTIKNYSKRGVLSPIILSDGTRAYDADDIDRVRAAMDRSKRKPSAEGER